MPLTVNDQVDIGLRKIQTTRNLRLVYKAVINFIRSINHFGHVLNLSEIILLLTVNIQICIIHVNSDIHICMENDGNCSETGLKNLPRANLAA